MLSKKETRLRRALKSRTKLKSLFHFRLCINKTSKHIYAQIISPDNMVLVSASSLGKIFLKQYGYGGNKSASDIVGRIIAEKALKKGIKKVSFDRSGFRYHGRIKSLAESARNSGLRI